MGLIDFTWHYVVLFLVLLTILVFFHELGHFWVARRNGVRVEVFSVGFGPELFGYTDRLGTRWKFSAVPLGGYVKMLGEGDFDGDDDDRKLSPEEQELSFNNKTLKQRAAIVAAGPAANFLLAVVLLWGVFATYGMPVPQAGVGLVQEGSVAAEIGLQKGDLIVAIDEEPLVNFKDLSRIVSANPGREIVLQIQRDGADLQVAAVPRPVESADPDSGETIIIGRLGVSPDPEQVYYERLDPATALWMGVVRTYALTVRILNYVGGLVSGAQDADQLGGPIRIAQISGDMAKGGIVPYILFMAALSVNLGLLNLFPIPMLDGGHLVFYAFEAVLGRPLGPRAQEYGFRFGLILVLLLMVYVTWNDLVRIYTDYIGSL